MSNGLQQTDKILRLHILIDDKIKQASLDKVSKAEYSHSDGDASPVNATQNNANLSNTNQSNTDKHKANTLSDEFECLRAEVARLEKQIVELKRQNTLQDQVINLNQDCIFVKDKHAEFVFANQAAQAFYQSAKGITLNEQAEAFSDAQLQRFAETDQLALQKGLFQAREKVTLADGSETFANYIKKRFIGDDGEPYLLCISKEETERESLINDLKRSNQDLDNFAYVASHDLRAPLNAIQTIVSWVLEDTKALLPPDAVDNLSLVMNRAERMEKLLKDLLEYSRTGRKMQKPVNIQVKDKVFELLNLVDLPMGFGLHCDDTSILVPEVPFSVVMVNLINNAIKHHDSTNANIDIKVKKKVRTTSVIVADDGPGVPDEFKGKVFELFRTLKSRDEVEGSGMGLSVVKKLVEQYGGSVAVEDNLPRGTRFIVNWPTKYKELVIN
ncbi:sensor histidine kinase [Agaribacter flavus]|uniref:histidine kinase n=1 Tax=Agaribacter flavus TaxID=1902781 RepID=A0ABV7FM25_9ALTE